jgi:putative colanic acid biosynthesis UDP-glucose lipid carrier transferase
VHTAIEPAVAVGTLLVSSWCFTGKFGGPELILALLVFAMTYPGNARPRLASSSIVMREIAIDWSIIAGLLLTLGWATRTLVFFDLQAIAAWMSATPLLLFAAHRLIPLALARLLATDGMRRTAVIVGANEPGCDLHQRIGASPLSGVKVVGYFDDRGPGRLGGVPPSDRLGTLDQLADFVRRQRIDVIYIALPMCSQPRIRKLLEDLHDTTASIYFVPDIFLFDLIQARVDLIGGIPVLAVCESPFYGINALVKRASDLALAGTALLLTSPLLLAIAWGVKRSSPGPVLFKQRRYGMDGREIVVYKFRTMTCTEDGNAIRQAARGDPRVTRFGRFLREYSLDELPQFINVLQGRMSVVGPRPHAVAHNEMYRKLIRGYMLRHKVKPGITGLAQVNGLRGETDTIEKMRSRVECDLEYLRHWSLILDLQIVLKTAVVVLLRKGNAY